MWSLLALFPLLAAVNGVTEFPVYKLVQYDYEHQHFGSQVAALNFLGTHLEKAEDIPRRLVITKLDQITENEVSAVIAQKASALLIILPPKDEIQTNKAKLAEWKALEEYLGRNVFNIPIYFTWENEAALSVYTDITSDYMNDGSSDDQLQFVVNTDEKTALTKIKLSNFYGFIYDYEESLPIIALVTHYDSFSVLPDDTIGMNENGSGVIAMMELARIFYKVYQQNFPNYNLLILLTQAGTLNFDGARQWLSSEDPFIMQLIQKISFAICLDSISEPGKLYAHISRHPKPEETEVTRLYAAMNTTATLTEFPLEYSKKKINIADPFIPWQHENFSRRRVIGATLSSRETSYVKLLDHSSIFDRTLDPTILKRNIRFIAETLVRFLYDQKETDKLVMYNKPDLVNATRVDEVMERLTETTRFPSQLTPSAPLTKEIQANFSVFSNDFQSKEFELDEFTLYSSKPETMVVYRVKPAIYDFYFFIGVLLYVGALWGVVRFAASFSFISKKPKKS